MATRYRTNKANRRIGNYHAKANNPAYWASMAAEYDSKTNE